MITSRGPRVSIGSPHPGQAHDLHDGTQSPEGNNPTQDDGKDCLKGLHLSKLPGQAQYPSQARDVYYYHQGQDHHLGRGYPHCKVSGLEHHSQYPYRQLFSYYAEDWDDDYSCWQIQLSCGNRARTIECKGKLGTSMMRYDDPPDPPYKPVIPGGLYG